MKKVTQVLAVFLFYFSVMAISSCKRCVECEYSEFHDNHYDEVKERKCGNKKEIKKFEEDMAAEAAAHDTTVTCLEVK